MEETHKKSLIFVFITLGTFTFCSGCSEYQKLIFGSAMQGAAQGAIIGTIVGYQSREEGEGAAVGAAVNGTVALVGQIINTKKSVSPRHGSLNQSEEYVLTPKKYENWDDIIQVYVYQIQNNNGTLTPIELIKQGNIYIGHDGQKYKSLPTEKDLQDALRL